jgi:hypothetical protein
MNELDEGYCERVEEEREKGSVNVAERFGVLNR